MLGGFPEVFPNVNVRSNSIMECLEMLWAIELQALWANLGCLIYPGAP